VNADRLDHHSFEPPFDEIESTSGKKIKERNKI